MDTRVTLLGPCIFSQKGLVLTKWNRKNVLPFQPADSADPDDASFVGFVDIAADGKVQERQE